MQELEETKYWLELLTDSGILARERLDSLQQEAKELTAILVACVKSAKNKRKQPREEKTEG